MTKKYLYSRQRFARHMDSKIEQNFDKVIRSPFNDYFSHNVEELSNDCIQSIKESMCATVCENIDLLVREITMQQEEEQQQKPVKKERKKKATSTATASVAPAPVPAPVVVIEEEEEEEVFVEEAPKKKKSPKTKKKKSASDE